MIYIAFAFNVLVLATGPTTGRGSTTPRRASTRCIRQPRSTSSRTARLGVRGFQSLNALSGVHAARDQPTSPKTIIFPDGDGVSRVAFIGENGYQAVALREPVTKARDPM